MLQPEGFGVIFCGFGTFSVRSTYRRYSCPHAKANQGQTQPSKMGGGGSMRYRKQASPSDWIDVRKQERNTGCVH